PAPPAVAGGAVTADRGAGASAAPAARHDRCGADTGQQEGCADRAGDLRAGARQAPVIVLIIPVAAIVLVVVPVVIAAVRILRRLAGRVIGRLLGGLLTGLVRGLARRVVRGLRLGPIDRLAGEHPVDTVEVVRVDHLAVHGPIDERFADL